MSELSGSGVSKKSQLFAYVRFMLCMLVILVAVNVGVYMRNFYAGLLMSCGLVAYAAVIILYYILKRKSSMPALMGFVTTFSTIQNRLMNELPFSYALTNDKGEILWMNEEFKKLIGGAAVKKKTAVYEIFPEISEENPTESEEEAEISFDFGEKHLRALIRPAVKNNELKNFSFPDVTEEELGAIYSLSVFDETDLVEYMQKYEDEILVPGLLYIDNYDETIDTLEDVGSSIATAIIDRKLNQYFGGIDAIIRKFEKGKYFFAMRNRTLEELKNDKFPLLADIRSLKIAGDMSVTISMGIAVNQGSYNKNLDAAKAGIELALGRGGDQVVLKDAQAIQYFGAKTMAVEKNTRVKARVKASALREIMEACDTVLIMGHKLMDIDAFGAAVGIYKAARSINKKAAIVVDNPDKSTVPFMERFLDDPDSGADMFLGSSVAMQTPGEQAMLVVVDTCRASYTECPELLDLVKHIVVLDHHRQSSDVIRNTSLSYIEPYASSACEMVTEIIQYFDENLKLKNMEADALYAGMVVDTNNFTQRTGVRTFEAAAYLRRSGADMIRVRKLFRDNLEDYKSRGEVLRNAKMFRDKFAISTWEAGAELNPTLVGARAANELLNINGVKASFVLTKFNDVIYISARAIDEINVQLIMERLGGGGHLSVAGCQLYGVTMDEAVERLKKVLEDTDEGGR